MGDSILSSLSTLPPSKVTKTTEQFNHSEPLQGLAGDTHAVSFVDDLAVDVITVTDYAEVELAASTDIEVVVEESCYEGADGATVADSQAVLPEGASTENEAHATEEIDGSGSVKGIFSEVVNEDTASSQITMSVGPHDCQECKKKFKFASSLNAHRVIHTGERPHRCGDCGRCFSFRQSLDRHRHTHKTGRKYDCLICSETFHSLSARTEHKQTHMEDGVYTCQQCSKTFRWELALARHVKTHTDDLNANSPTQSHKLEQEVVICDGAVSGASITLAEPDRHAQTDSNGQLDSGNGEAQSIDRPTTEPREGNSINSDVVSQVKVRTSGRKRKPTMKIQVINFQKRMTSKRRQELIKTNPPVLKPLPFSW